MLRMGKSVSMVTNYYPLKKKKKPQQRSKLWQQLITPNINISQAPSGAHHGSVPWLLLWPLSSPSSQSKGCMFSDSVLLCAAPAASCTVVQQHQMLCYYVPKPQSHVVTGCEEESEPSRFYSRTQYLLGPVVWGCFQLLCG